MINFIKWTIRAADDERLPIWVRSVSVILVMVAAIVVGVFAILVPVIVTKMIGLWIIPFTLFCMLVSVVIYYKNQK